MANGPDKDEVEGKKSCRGCRVMQAEEENRKRLQDSFARSDRTAHGGSSKWFPITTSLSSPIPSHLWPPTGLELDALGAVPRP